jgi:putative membrane protein
MARICRKPAWLRAIFGRRPSLWKGFLAGAIGGLIGSANKAAAESLYPPRVHGEPEPPVVLANRILGRRLNHKEKECATVVIHYLFGTLTGGVYGALAEHQPSVTAGAGTLFGAVLLLCTHESAFPALGLSAPPQRQSSREQASEAATHLVYGLTTELIRRQVRRAL